MTANSIMIQGTASSVGKSVIAAGLCRIFSQDGYKVAPFKSQNMALNSFVTRDGKEMGRAQVVQAEACKVEPDVKMNPVLIKPVAERKAQVIVEGKVYGNMSAIEYHNFKPGLAKLVKNIYNELAVKNDIIILEGAGSPAEINLRDKDIVNMGMAEMSDSPVVLIGDIDKGGVFASLVGTMMLLSDNERDRVKGVIINKFRGDIELLRPGLKTLEKLLKVPVIGVIPYFNHVIDDEDSLGERLLKSEKAGLDEIDVVVIKLPHISNFTDFNVFESIEGVKVRYVDDSCQIGNPDLVIIPGTKNTIGDLLFLRKNGFEEVILNLNKEGTVIFGICGGYQMLGEEILDLHGVESDISYVKGFGILNFKTVFKQEKSTKRIVARITESSFKRDALSDTVEGYEIHMGNTEYSKDCITFIKSLEDNLPLGIRNKKGNVLGTYLHGIFDNVDFTISLINKIRSKKGFADIDKNFIKYKDMKEQEYDKLAEILRANLDISFLYKIMNFNI
ncbi:cobyric acid synthase [Herbivorax sp. ANBcel31]|uniref:cobyric acid synthase n=1 Tax=Herbivorax sp. ANBcel31 TaxID=3069754 RepID=UPI0027B649B7|nr:cobyric acid synthase [Herbivorax sp. ANBcel31]MDQ2085508.1 cobyric acid synthase [Herbivorax sp. ANBcel31]